jgi:osomolarity two-component system sensor histidine kinase NIK1
MIKQIKVLVVEDNPLNCKILSFYLKKMDLYVKISSSGEDAVDTYKNEFFDIILMDLMLPGISGYETTRQIRKIENEACSEERTFIIALTANTMDNDREKCMKEGMDEYMSKPFEMRKLLDIFDSLKMNREKGND